jgi:hypothetical protein
MQTDAANILHLSMFLQICAANFIIELLTVLPRNIKHEPLNTSINMYEVHETSQIYVTKRNALF